MVTGIAESKKPDWIIHHNFTSFLSSLVKKNLKAKIKGHGVKDHSSKILTVVKSSGSNCRVTVL